MHPHKNKKTNDKINFSPWFWLNHMHSQGNYTPPLKYVLASPLARGLVMDIAATISATPALTNPSDSKLKLRKPQHSTIRLAN
jgi:hypothetical protein